MTPLPVSIENIHAVWPRVEGYIADVIPKAQGDISLDSVKLNLLNGAWLLVVIVDELNDIHGAAVMSITNQLNARVAHGVCLGGKFVTDVETIRKFKDLLRSYGVTVVESSVGAGMARLWARHGFVEKYRIVKLNLNEGDGHGR